MFLLCSLELCGLRSKVDIIAFQYIRLITVVALAESVVRRSKNFPTTYEIRSIYGMIFQYFPLKMNLLFLKDFSILFADGIFYTFLHIVDKGVVIVTQILSVMN